ncbi:MAG: polysaccharide biosynthesis tyrosine autokinase [Saprospiraceae bacterium]
MTFNKEYKMIIRPLLKASPVLIGLITIAILVTRRAVTYMTPEYRAGGAIKINNLNYTQAAINLFGEENEKNLPRQNENFLAEVEVFQTRDLIRKTLENLHWELTTYRVGDVRLSEIFEERPFKIDYGVNDDEALDKTIYFDYLGEGRFRFFDGSPKDSAHATIVDQGQLIEKNGLLLTIEPDSAFLKLKPNSLKPGDLFALKVNSEDALIGQYKSDKLFVKPVDKEVSIIKVYFNHELPEKAQTFVNTLMKTYIEEGRKSREQQVAETLDYLEKQLEVVKKRLSDAEAGLAGYRSENQLINSTQETDAVLRELTQLNLQKVDLDMKTSELKRLQEYLLSGNSLSDFSPNFEALSDPIFRGSYLKAQSYEEQRQDYLQKYTLQHPLILNLDQKIKETRAFLNESVNSTLENLQQKTLELESQIAEVNQKVERFPEKERQLVVLQRQVALNEALYNYLMRKYTELSIMQQSDLFPHKIIEHAVRPKATVAPNKSLYYGMAFLLALLAGMFYAYLRSYVKETVSSKDELEEKLPQYPIIGEVYRLTRKTPPGFSLVSGLTANLRDLPKPETKGQAQLFVLSSNMPNEGKTFVSARIAKAMAAYGYKVLLLDLDVRKPELHEELGMENSDGFCEAIKSDRHALDLVQNTSDENLYFLPAGQYDDSLEGKVFSAKALDIIHDLRWHFDMVIVDVAPIGLFDDSIVLMRKSTANLFLIRKGTTRLRQLKPINELLDSFQIPNLYLVLNGVRQKAKKGAYARYLKKRKPVPALS